MLNLQFAGSLTFPDFSLKYSEINLPPTQVLTNLLSSSYCTTAGNSKWIKKSNQATNWQNVLTNYHLQSIAQLAKVSQKTNWQNLECNLFLQRGLDSSVLWSHHLCLAWYAPDSLDTGFSSKADAEIPKLFQFLNDFFPYIHWNLHDFATKMRDFATKTHDC